jgi:hypothetical protein
MGPLARTVASGAVKSASVRHQTAFQIAVVALLSTIAAAATYVAVGRAGAIVVAAPLLIVAVVLLVARPAAVLTILLVATILCEFRAPGLLQPTGAFYEPPVAGLAPYEAVILLLVAATVLDVSRRQQFRSPRPFTLALAVMAFALLFGVINGLMSLSDTSQLGGELRRQLVLLLMPFLVVNVVRNQSQTLQAVKIAAGLVAIKTIVGLLAATSGSGTAAVYGQSLTYYEPTSNWLMILFLLTFAAILLTRAPLWRWLIPIVPLAFATLLLSYRRGWWIGTVAGLIVVIVVGLGPLGRRLLVPAVVVLAFGIWGVFAAGLVNDRVQGPVAQRIQSLDPNKLQHNVYDDYRNVERRNAFADVQRHPIAGLGLGSRWTAQYPTPVAFPDARSYTHFVALWYWMKLGVIGLIGYLLLMGSLLYASYQVFKRNRDPILRAAGLGILGSTVALIFTEMTESNTGVDPPFTIVIGALLGLLACAYSGADSGESIPAPNPPEASAA